MRRRCLGAVARWACTGVSVLLVVIWALTPWYTGVWVLHPYCRLQAISVFGDDLEVSWRSPENSEPDDLPSLPFYGRIHVLAHQYFPPRWHLLPEYKRNPVRGWITVPLWLPIALSMIPTAVLWQRVFMRRRRRLAGLCPECGYDRGGLAADAKCPECGTVPAPASK